MDIYNVQKTVKINPDGEGNIVIKGHKIKLEENQEIQLEFGLKDELQLLGQNILLCELQGIFGATINYTSIHYIVDLKEYEVELSTVKNKSMYCSSQYFLTKEELKKLGITQNIQKHFQMRKSWIYNKQN